MFEYSKKNFNTSFNATLVRQVGKELNRNNVTFNIETINRIELPPFAEDIIPELDSVFKDNRFELYGAIAKILKYENFYNVDINIAAIDKNLIVGEDFVVYDGVLYKTNPLDVKTTETIRQIKLFKKDDLFFNSVGIISNDLLESLKELIVNNSGAKEKTPIQTLELKYQNIINKSIANNIKEVKLRIVDAGKLVIDYKKNIGYIKDLREIIRNVDFVEYLINKSINQDSINNIRTFLKKENDKTYKLLIYNNINKDFGDVLGQIRSSESFEINEIIDLFKLNKSGVIFITSLDDSCEKLTYQIVDEIRKTKSVDISIFDKYEKYKMKESIFNSNYEDVTSVKSDIIIIKIYDDEDFDSAIDIARSGKMVYCHFSSSSVKNTVERIKFAYKNELESTIIKLKGVLHITQVDKVCRNCATTEIFNENKNHYLISKTADDILFKISKENESGCFNCVFGYEDKINIFEIIENNITMKRYLSGEADVDQFITEKESDDWVTSLNSALKHLKEGRTTINSIINNIDI